jgi:DNA helicase-2/ATP-dependent DNA helicase PcrA
MNPSSAQQQVIDSTSTNLLCLAGPGSGKTKTLIWRIERLLRERVLPEQIIVITFTRAAAAEIERRLYAYAVDAQPGTIRGPRLGYCGTLHGYMLRLLNAHPEYFAGRTPITVLSEEAAETLLDQICARMGYRGSKAALALAIAAGPRFGHRAASLLEITASEFYRSLMSSNMLTYDAILHFGLRLVGSAKVIPDGTHLMVDEFQDSAEIDNHIYSSMQLRSRFFIGDVDQTIFSFRGSCLENIDTFHGDRLLLEANYRSDFAICAAAQRLIEHNKGRAAKSTISVSGEQGVVRFTQFDTESEEAAAIGREIIAIPPDHTTIAVLLRTNEMVDYFADLFKAFLPVPLHRQFMPHDWSRTSLLLSLLSDPSNDWLATQWLTREHDAIKAGSIALAAAHAHQSINEHSLHLPQSFPFTQLVYLLSKAACSPESINKITAASSDLEPDATVADLLFSLRHESVSVSAPGLVVCTVHAAKGREFDRVYLPAFEQCFIPGIRKSMTPDDLEEERRIAYVALTRARHEVIITASRQRRTRWLTAVDSPPSQFVHERGL